jgi:hypothetical protein
VIVVASAGSNELRFFSPDGEFLRQAGREGGGPGESRALWSVSRYRGDSLVAYDFQLRRVTVFTPEWGASRIIRLEGLPVRNLVALDDGTFVSRFFYPSTDLYEGESGVLVREPNPLVHLSPFGEILDAIAMVQDMRSSWLIAVPPSRCSLRILNLPSTTGESTWETRTRWSSGLSPHLVGWREWFGCLG